MSYSATQIWVIIVLMGIGTFIIRFSFLGAFGRITLPPFVMRLLRYTPVAILPGLVAPLVLWPDATGGEPDLARLIAAFVALVFGLYFKNILASIIAGMATLLVLMNLLV